MKTKDPLSGWRCWGPGAALGIASWLALNAGAVARTPQNDGTSPVITVRVYDYAQVSRREFDQAIEEATRVLGRAGVEVDWVDCRLTEITPATDPVCRRYPGPTEILLRIQSHSISEVSGTKPDMLGIAYLDGSGLGGAATVFYERVVREADHTAKELPRAILLGCAAAHEFGHLLLGSNTHSYVGIMRAQWGREELHLAAQGSLRFTDGQAEAIRIALRSRAQM